ncbi:hypothetical protein CPB84DRAFT_1774054 [Gymnopilus junonius]|uniref:Uncharacterized protein n=1 Tax=Gymnopilus junonius TaxID=109634 RepID=A0A9P5NU26_GYMJU|nr:hypothetical protein CPB84DRAFT_1774054 [Gymnopilus junonius]
MSSGNTITAYPAGQGQSQSTLGAGKRPNIATDYTKVECWGDNGKPHLVEYSGSGKLKGQTAIVTGGASGDTENAKDAKRLIEQSGATCNTVCTDLMDSNACKNVVDSHMKAFGKLNVLVNNASKQMTSDKFENIDLHNVENTFKATSSKFDFASTEGAIVSFTRSLAVQLMDRGIRVNAVAPGPVNAAPQAGSRTPESIEALGAGLGTPLHGRVGQPAEVAPSFVFLASSKDSNIVTGQVIHVNSGLQTGSS